MSLKRIKNQRTGKTSWQFRIEINGRTVRGAGYATREEAEVAEAHRKLVSRRERDGMTPLPSRIRLSELIARRIKDLGEKTGPRRRVASILRRWAGLLRPEIMVEEITVSEIRVWVDYQFGRKVQPQTVVTEVAHIYAALNSAHAYFPELENYRPPRKPKILHSSRGRESTWDTADVKILLEYLDTASSHGALKSRRDAADLLRLALTTGCRLSELLALTWHQIDFGHRTIRIIGTKTDRYRLIPMTGTMKALLEGRKTNSQWVFPSPVDPATHRSLGIVAIIKHACAKLKIPYGRKTAGGLVFHDLRHTATTRMLQAGIDIRTVQSITGHSTPSMMMRYAHPTRKSQEKAMEALEELTGK